MVALWQSLMRIRWEVPLPVTLGFWRWIQSADGETRPIPRRQDGAFGRWFWELSDAQREEFLADKGMVPPPLARSAVRLLTLSLGLKWSLWKLPDHIADLIEEAHEDLLLNGAQTAAGVLPPVATHKLLPARGAELAVVPGPSTTRRRKTASPSLALAKPDGANPVERKLRQGLLFDPY